jgi:hypothetical protein
MIFKILADGKVYKDHFGSAIFDSYDEAYDAADMIEDLGASKVKIVGYVEREQVVLSKALFHQIQQFMLDNHVQGERYTTQVIADRLIFLLTEAPKNKTIDIVIPAENSKTQQGIKLSIQHSEIKIKKQLVEMEYSLYSQG